MTMTFRRSFFLALVVFPVSFAFLVVPSLRNAKRLSLYQDPNENDEEEILYDDFDFVIGGGDDNDDTTPSSSLGLGVLQDRVNQLNLQEQETQVQISENWKNGHWSVRGCSLDPGDDFGSKIQVSALCPMDDDTLLVGRTDGSICWLQLGSEYLATFTNQLVAKETSNETISVTHELKRDDDASISMPMQPNQNFEVLGQLQVATSAITNMVVSLDSEYLFVVSQDRPNEIQQFEISHDGPSSKDPIAVLEETHSLVGLKVVEDKESNNYLLSTSRKGQVSLWKIGKSTTTTMTQITIPIEDDDIVLSTDVDSDYLFIGSEQGMVWVYSLEHLLSEPKEDECVPLKSFKAFPNGGVSAICAAGPGTMGRGDTTTTALVTGSTSGGIKQWELIPRGKHALEYWPKLVSQTMPGKAHLLGRGGDDGEPILDLKVIDDVVLSVAPSRSTIWNTATGKSYFDMEGLEFEATRPSCIVLSSHLLVTNGMEQYVCVHDFSVAELENIEDMIERDNDDDDYGDNNTDDDW